MHRIPVALISIAGVATLAACGSESATTSPRDIAPRAHSAVVVPACSFSNVSQAAKSYFASKDTVFTMISDMKTTFNKSGRAAATPKGFDVLTRTEVVRRAGLEIGTGAAGGTFVLDLVGCMDVGTASPAFDPGASLTSGIFAVRGNVAADSAALAYNASPNTAATFASPLWGVEPGPGNDWTRPVADAPYGRYLVYGYPLNGPILTGGFELGSLPTTVGADTTELFRVGVCVQESQGTVVNRLLHGGLILTGDSTTFQGAKFCNGHLASAASKTWYRALASRVLSALAPKSADAQLGITYGVGGLPDGWSPFAPSTITPSTVSLTFTTLPTNAVDSTNTTAVVHAAAPGFANLPGVLVTIAIAGNSGSPAQAVLISGTDCQPNHDCTPLTVATDHNGNANFVIQIGKSGGYTLSATGSLSGLTTPTDTSAVFNVKNK
jgi:hypothetical protein